MPTMWQQSLCINVMDARCSQIMRAGQSVITKFMQSFMLYRSYTCFTLCYASSVVISRRTS
jgi:hypothetical protein